MIKEKGGLSISTAALITGLTLFVPTAPYAEFYVFKRLIISNNAAQTAQNLLKIQNSSSPEYLLYFSPTSRHTAWLDPLYLSKTCEWVVIAFGRLV